MKAQDSKGWNQGYPACKSQATRNEVSGAPHSLHFPLGFPQIKEVFPAAESQAIVHKVRKTPVVNDPETGSLSSKPFMATTLTRYSAPGKSLTSLVRVLVPSTVTSDGVPGTWQKQDQDWWTSSKLTIAPRTGVSDLKRNYILIQYHFFDFLSFTPALWHKRRRLTFCIMLFFHPCRCQKPSQEGKKHEVTMC